MGSACCVAARDRTVPSRTRSETLHRDSIYSPTWSFRWENRRCIADDTENPSYQVSQVSRRISRDVSMEMKGSLGSERGHFSDMGSPLENYGTPLSPKSPVHEEMGKQPITHTSGLSIANNYSTEVMNLADSPDIAGPSAPKLSFSIPSSSLTPIGYPLSAQTHPLPPNSTPSRRARRSPGHQLLRQISDSRILALKSPNNNSISEGRPSFVLSTCSNDLTGSQGWSSDGWSMRTFSELVASSQRERWSFDSEHFGSGRGKIGGSSGRLSYSPSIDLQTCGACSKLLIERSSWSSQKIIAGNELSVVAVLICGHAYHAECLETMTMEADKYDPACPICMVGEKQVSTMTRKALKAEAELKAKYHKISRHRVVDSYLDSDFDDFIDRTHARPEGKVPKMEPSSSTRSSFAKPFLKRHFTLGSKWNRSLSENDSARKKGFWARYRKD